MPHFLDTVETIGEGLGFELFGNVHLVWLAVTVVVIAFNVIWYRKMTSNGRKNWRIVVAILLIADELFKMAILIAGSNFLATYLPLHLCSINIFLIAWHAFRPSDTLSNFLYMVCIPGALAAILFPSWASLPPTCGMHIHSFTVHILLAMYPLTLAVNGDIKIRLRSVPKSFLILIVMAVIIYPVNMLLDTNFMFLMYADPGNPLYWFGENWGSHLLGFPVIIAGVLLVLYLPLELYRKIAKK